MTFVELIRQFVAFLTGMLTSLSSSLPDPAWLKVLVIAVLTWGWEEPVSVGSAIMVASGNLPFWLVFAALAIGFPTGDSLLYLLGRFGKQFVENSRWYRHSEAVRDSSRWFNRNVIGAVFVARFTPGLRFPTFVAAGMLHVPFHRFLALPKRPCCCSSRRSSARPSSTSSRNTRSSSAALSSPSSSP